MAFSPEPADWIPGYASNSGANSFSVGTVNNTDGGINISNADADAVTGDIRKVTLALVEALYESWTERDPANRPTKMKIESRGQEAGPTLVRSYTFTFTLTEGDVTVIAE